MAAVRNGGATREECCAKVKERLRRGETADTSNGAVGVAIHGRKRTGNMKGRERGADWRGAAYRKEGKGDGECSRGSETEEKRG